MADPLKTINYSALQHPVSFVAILTKSFERSGFVTRAAFYVAIIAAAFIFLRFIALPQGDLTEAIVAIFGVGIVIVLPFFVFQIRKSKQILCMEQFAADNDFDFTAERSGDLESGMIFGIGRARTFVAEVKGEHQKLPFQFSNYYFTTGSGRNQHTTDYGVVCVKLSRHLPNVLLDGKQNNFGPFRDVPRYQNSQKLQLEGDFNEYFDLYVPYGYERDALYFLTPELMQALIDYGAKFDVEVIDDRLYIYSTSPFKLDKEETIRAIFDVINLLGSEFQDNIARYADANVGNRKADIVAMPGQRLKRTFSWVVVAIVVAYIVFWAL